MAGSILFTLIMFVSAAFWGCLVLVLRLFGYRVMYGAVRFWCQTMLVLLKWLCGLDYTVRGLDRIPAQNTVVLMKHSSSWETIAQFLLFPRQTWVMKRELIWAPILGWVLYFLHPIAINRQGGRTAVDQVIAQGKRRLEDGFWVVVFPEGTRMPAGQTRRYGLSGTLLAQAAGRPIVPVTHNAGYYWPRRGWLKKPGTIEVVIGEPVDPTGREPRELNAEIQSWIESEIERMSRPGA